MSKKIFLFVGVVMVFLLLFLVLFYKPESEEELSPKMQEIMSKNKIIVGTNAAFPPMETFDEQGNFIGIDIEIAKKIAESLGVKAELKQIEWQDIFDTLIADEVDILISGITITPERAEKMAFSNPYFNAGQVIVIHKDEQEIITEVKNLNNRILGAQEGTTGYAEAKDISNDVIGYIDYSEAKQGLLNREIEAIIVDYPVAISLVKGQNNMIIVGEPFTQEFYGIAVQKENEMLLEKINETLVNLKKSGQLDQIIQNYIEE
jgi:ABC-type amino acid transport substrate-binding protein